MRRRTTLAIVLTASLAVACWTTWLANRPACSCVLGESWSTNVDAWADTPADPADCDRHHGEVE